MKHSAHTRLYADINNGVTVRNSSRKPYCEIVREVRNHYASLIEESLLHQKPPTDTVTWSFQRSENQHIGKRCLMGAIYQRFDGCQRLHKSTSHSGMYTWSVKCAAHLHVRNWSTYVWSVHVCVIIIWSCDHIVCARPCDIMTMQSWSLTLTLSYDQVGCDISMCECDIDTQSQINCHMFNIK
jgi:hypothetical protein